MKYLVCIIALFCQENARQEVPKADASQVAQKKAQPKLTSREALERLNVLVGDWRGIGQPKRGSRQGAWSEKANCTWDFSRKSVPALKLVPKGSKQLKSLRVEFDEKRAMYAMRLEPIDKQQATPLLLAKPDPRKLVFQSEGEGAERYRMTVQILSRKRVTLLFEKGKKTLRRAWGVGYTRSGTSIANRGSGEPVCVVTGGVGSIRVKYKGRDYFVCCSGCQQAFADDPEGVLADFAERLKREKARKKKAAERAGAGK